MRTLCSAATLLDLNAFHNWVHSVEPVLSLTTVQYTTGRILTGILLRDKSVVELVKDRIICSSWMGIRNSLVCGRCQFVEFFLCVCNALLVTISTGIAQNVDAIVNIQS